MKYLLCTFSIIYIRSMVFAATDPHKLTAVNGENIAADLYQRIKNMSPGVEKWPALDTNTKNRICYHITGSGFFVGELEKRQITIHQVYTQMLLKEPNLFLELYEATTNSDLIYKNRTKAVNVKIFRNSAKTYSDHAFICLSLDATITINAYQNESDTNLNVYLVSREYNVSDTPASTYIAGRFIFFFLEGQPTLAEVCAVAEVPAESLSTRGASVERSYLENRKGNEPAKEEIDDPICTLTRRERLRVCTLVLSSAYFEGELKFVPNKKYLDEKACYKKDISFQDNGVKLDVGVKVYQEWMIGCIPQQRYATFQALYLLSRVYNSVDEVFVHRLKHDYKSASIVLENRFGNIRFKV